MSKKTRARRAAIKREKAREKRAAMIAKHKPQCPDCHQPFTADSHVNRCSFCGYYLCDSCANGGQHRCKVKLGTIGEPG
jgi:hypothetical protein